MSKNKIKIFQLTKDKKVKLHYKGPFVAQKRLLFIEIDEYFELLDKEEQKVTIWHEIYHRDKASGLRFLWRILKFRSKKKAIWEEEFEADKYSAIMCGKKNVLKSLNTSKKLYEKGIVEYNPKTHPKIEERIKRIKELRL